jgi:Rps23 Pro-64 3,4-dihydroxylase Tpa1-like proline 4-hydroxylase
MSQLVNPIYFEREKIEELKKSFNEAKPCRHMVLDNFLTDDVANTLFSNFPAMDELNVKRKSINEDKREDYHFERFHPMFAEVRAAIMGPELKAFFEEISGLKDIECTPDGYGCGVHQGANGSFVDVHLDFNMHTEKNMHRRLNMLIYLNKHWKEEYGGHLELWDQEVKHCVSRVLPAFNRAVIFRTDEQSYHGVAKVTCPEGETRKSIYSYYYTPIGDDFVYRDSRFKSRPEEGSVRGAVVEAKETFKVNAKRFLKAIGFSKLDFQDKNKD